MIEAFRFPGFFQNPRKTIDPPRFLSAMTDLPSPESSLGTLLRFLGAFDQSAAAHSREALTDEQEAMLTAFARGDLDEGGRSALIPLLSRNTLALERLAALLKAPPGGASAR